MKASAPAAGAVGETRVPLTTGRKAAIAVACVVAGFLPVAAAYVPGGVARLAYSLVVTAGLLGLALFARRSATLARYWEIPLVFFGMALFWLADQYVPPFLRTQVLHVGTLPGNPIASTLSGTIVLQLDELVLTVLAVLVVLWISGTPLSSIYVRRGRFGRAYVIGFIGLVALYLLTFRALQHSNFVSFKGTLDFSRYLGLTPALLVVVAANAFLEELFFRGLLMSRLNIAFGPYLATLVQAVIFTSWHAGITYTPFLLAFLLLFIFPVGLVAGYLTRSSGSILPAWLFHMGADVPLYVGFLSYVS